MISNYNIYSCVIKPIVMLLLTLLSIITKVTVKGEKIMRIIKMIM